MYVSYSIHAATVLRVFFAYLKFQPTCNSKVRSQTKMTLVTFFDRTMLIFSVGALRV